LEQKVNLWFHDHFDPLVAKFEWANKPYRLSVWTVSGHLNTFINANRPPKPLDYRRDSITATDGATLVLDWFGEHNTAGPTVFILPGVSGHSQAGYITPLVTQLSNDGYCVVIHTHPGMNGAPLTKGRFSRVFDSEDTARLISYIKKSRGDSPIVALGYSLGAAMLVKYIGGHQHDEVRDGIDSMPLSAAIIVSCPWDFNQIIEHIQASSMAGLYDRYFSSIYKEAIINSGQNSGFSEEVIEQAIKSNSLREIDELIMKSVWGFTSLEEYYSKIGCIEEVKNVQIPLLILHANDDPLVPTHVVPKEAIKQNKYIVYAETQKGGHVAWLSGLLPTRGLSWQDQTSLSCIEGFIEHLHPHASPRVQRAKKKAEPTPEPVIM